MSPPAKDAGLAAVGAYRAAVDSYLGSVWGKSSPLAEAMAGILEAGGKRLRPVICLLACEAVSGDYTRALPVAASFELAHSASLVQDDIIDESEVRHGRAAAHKSYGETKAMLVSDFMIFEIFLELAKYADSGLSARRLAKVSALIGNAAKLTAEGEYFESALAEKGSASEEEYVRLAELKTGSLFAAAAACGVLVGGGSAKQVEAAYEFGLALGVSFQTRDDILDIVGDEEATGKPLLKDLQNNATNVVLIHALAKADPYQRQAIHSLLYKKWYAIPEIQTLKRTLESLGSVDHAGTVEREYATKAKEALGALPDSEAKETLERLAEGLGLRTK
jgi:geranylgeranyl diphosphate synthase type I